MARRSKCDFVVANFFPTGDDEAGDAAIAVVDGTGDDDHVAEAAYLIGEAATRVALRSNGLCGVLTAARMVTKHPADEFPHPDAVIAMALVRRGQPTEIVHVGDSRAWAWASDRLTLLTEDHTLGQRKRSQGVGEEEAAQHDHETTNSVGRALTTPPAITSTTAGVILLTSDGVHKVLGEDAITELLRKHENNAIVCAEQMVEAAVKAGSTDDASAALIVVHAT